MLLDRCIVRHRHLRALPAADLGIQSIIGPAAVVAFSAEEINSYSASMDVIPQLRVTAAAATAAPAGATSVTAAAAVPQVHPLAVHMC